MSKSRNIADLGSNDVLETDANGVTVTGGVASDTLNVDSGTLFVDGTNNRVGVGTTNPNGKLTVTDGNDGLEFGNEGITGTTRIFAYDRNAGSEIDLIQRASTHIFQTDNSEAARIDSGGNLLVGTTSDSVLALGVRALSNGAISATRDNGNPLFVNRLNSDGEIIDIRKDGSTVGSIGTIGGDIYVGTGNTSVRFTGNDIRPVESDGSNNDNATDLGDPSSRFKDLYLSGGIYLGGTGSANYLDDYETGTWTLQDVSGAGLSLTVEFARYTKIGRIVYFECQFTYPTTSSTSNSQVTLPFTMANLTGVGSFGLGLGFSNDVVCNMNGSLIKPRDSNNVRYDNVDFSGKTLVISGFYET